VRYYTGMRQWIFPLFLFVNVMVLINLLVNLLVNLPDASADDRLRVFVSILPQKYFVEQIGRDQVEVSVMAPPGADPHSYEPRPKQMVELAGAKIYFAVGIEFETVWLDKIASANPGMRIVHIDEGIKKIPMVSGHAHGKHHHGEDSHDHGSADPHVWTSPPLVKIMAKNIQAALSEIDPAHENVYEANFKTFAAEIDAIDKEFKDLFSSNKKEVSFMVFHPAWGYFAKSYGLNQIPVEIEGKDPKPAQLQTLIEDARARGIKVIFVQPQFSSRNAETVAAAIGGQVVAADPLAYDWADNLRQQARQFKAALK
jgi:zinc transport system substrate-binding protein